MKKLALLMFTGMLTFGTCAEAAPVKMKDGTLFDAQYYAAAYPDVVTVLGNSPEALYKHYVAYGRDEGRKPYADADTSTKDEAPVSVTMVGDSVMLGAADEIVRLNPGTVVDAGVSRQVRKGLDYLKALDARGQLTSNVVISLGINSRFSTETGQALIDYLGKNRTIYWVNTHAEKGGTEAINSTIKQLADDNDNVTLIDWNSYATGHSDWFYSDGIHLKPKGRTGYATLVLKSVGVKL